ncbi:MAG: YfhO family protein [Prevotella sp.]|nr:YfhO family protein [Prevotella sp.]
MNTLKKCLPDVIVVALFAVLAFAYFYPADIEGRILYRHDSAAGKGMGQEISEYRQQTGETSRWTNSLFGGMPTYQIAPAYNSGKVLDQVANAYHLWLPDYVWYLFAYLLGFYILLRAFDFRQCLAALGSIVWAFSTYFLIIIAAGHYWKVMALAYLPPMIAGMVLAYKGKYLWAFVVTAIFAALEVQANHVQMTYYFLFPIAFIVIAYLVDAIRDKRLAHFAKATATCAAAALVGVSLNLSNLYHTWEYSKESMRGKSELVKKNSGNQTNSGLDRDYITQWSYGVDETLTLLIPNAKGGASVPMVMSETAMEHADNNYLPLYQQIGQYWGEQPGTSGPVYVGAFVMFLFVLGLFIVKGPLKWALLAATILSVLLSWGRNFMPFTDFFIDYVPMYAKFRTVASILVIAEFTIPLLAMLALKQIAERRELLTEKIKFVYVSLALTAGPCLLFLFFPGMFDYVSSSEMHALSQFPADQLQPLLHNLTEMREAVFTADCRRSLFIIIIGVFVLLLFKAGKLKTAPMAAILFVLCLGDLWIVNKRYLNDDMFVDKTQRDQPMPKSAAVDQILHDTSLDYRVLNLATNTFNENETSYYLKSIGGYHPAKLRRYQELIDAYISPEMQRLYPAIAESQGDMTQVKGDSIFPVLNMLNTKYFILPLEGGQTVPVQNPYAYGNAWIIDKVTYVDNANAELARVGKIDLRHEAVADKRFKAVLGDSKKQDGESIVKLTSYAPNRLTYDVSTTKGGVIVFAENYYPGWTALVDGKEVEIGRVNYVLRAISVTAGRHKVELSFFPKTVNTTEYIAYAAYVVILLAILLLVFLYFRKKES